MELGEITDEIRQSYQAQCYTRLGYALRDQLAARLKAEFQAEHFEVQTKDSRPGYRRFICLACNYTDPRHNSDDPAWQAEADRRLSTLTREVK